MIFAGSLSEAKQERLFDEIEKADSPHFLVPTKNGIAVVKCIEDSMPRPQYCVGCGKYHTRKDKYKV